MASSGLVLVDDPTPHVRLITLDRPLKRNALSEQALGELIAALGDAGKDGNVRAIIITGNGPFFCSGADLQDIAGHDAFSARAVRYLQDLSEATQSIRKPLIAAVNGPALGGGFELAMMCDIIFAGKSAYFALPEVQRGLIPGAGGTQRLTAAVGKFRAMSVILYGKTISSAEAQQAGLVCDVFEDANLLGQTLDGVNDMIKCHPEALGVAKEAVRRADDLCRDDNFERHLYWSMFSSQAKEEGVNEFLRKKAAAKK